MPLFIGKMIIYFLKIPKAYKKKFLKLICKFSKAAQYKVNK